MDLINYFFRYLRKLFPVYQHEMKKFLMISSLMFFILFNQNVLRILKDSIVIPEINAEITSFAKIYCLLPISALFIIVYAEMVNRFSFQKIYYFFSFFFLTFFLIFSFYIYPNIDFFHMQKNELDRLVESYPYLKWYLYLIANWSFILFYVLSELWPSVFYIVLFWQLINYITNTEEAKRFYNLFSLIGNSSLIFVGIFIMNIASENSLVKIEGYDNKLIFVQTSILAVVLMTIMGCIVIHFLFKNFISTKLAFEINSAMHKEYKPGLWESMQQIFSSKYLLFLFICSASFALTMNLIEMVWKAKIKEVYYTVNTFAEANSRYILWTGIVIMILNILGNKIMKRYGWFITAVVTPSVILITGGLFFILILFQEDAVLIIKVGAIQNVLAKGIKYSIWDTSKEMLYIPLQHELKTKGKAAVDVLSAKAGKSFSSLAQSILLIIFPHLTYILLSPVNMIIFFLACIVWLYALRKIYHSYQIMLATNDVSTV